MKYTLSKDEKINLMILDDIYNQLPDSEINKLNENINDTISLMDGLSYKEYLLVKDTMIKGYLLNFIQYR